jgi:hypothetical protein
MDVTVTTRVLASHHKRLVKAAQDGRQDTEGVLQFNESWLQANEQEDLLWR